jgi:ribosome biogenesis GTPase
MKNKKHSHHKPAKLLGTELEGLLITTYGANAELEDEFGRIVRCHIRKNADPVITGDRVYWLPEKGDTGTILGPLPRKSLLYRPENAHKFKLIAANIDALIMVAAPPPILSEDMIDRYLVAAELLKIQPILLLNKMDLLQDESITQVTQRLACYEKIGYKVIYSSTITRDGLTDLEHFLQDKTCVFVGASGVGKSSIIAALTAEESIRIGDVSASTRLGKHTTTTTRLYHLKSGGNLIDSPGVREFGLWHVSPDELLHGFIEFKPYLNRCKFRDCSHKKEPGCVLIEAVANQEIDEKRFLSYRKILENLSSRR